MGCGELQPKRATAYLRAASMLIDTSLRMVRLVTCVPGLRREKGNQVRQAAEATSFSSLRIFQRGSHHQLHPAARPPDPQQIGLVAPLLFSHSFSPFNR